MESLIIRQKRFISEGNKEATRHQRVIKRLMNDKITVAKASNEIGYKLPEDKYGAIRKLIAIRNQWVDQTDKWKKQLKASKVKTTPSRRVRTRRI